MNSEENLIEKKDEVPPINWVPDEILRIILSLLDAKTLMIVVPQVCKFWRSMCQELWGVHLDFRWWRRKKVPLEVLVGWWVLPALQNVGVADSGDSGSEGVGAQQEGHWVSGICALFPHTTSATMGYKQEVEDAHVLALADKCRGLTHANFANCVKLTDATVLELVAKCRGLTRVDFSDCRNLTDAVVLELVAKCRRLTHAFFGGCYNLTNSAMGGLADMCRGLTHANFSSCENLTDAAVVALADKCPGITHADFYCCYNLTDAAVLALADKCPGITHVNFGYCENLTDVAVVALADKCPGITHANFSECENLTDEVKALFEAQHPNCDFMF